jgi:lipopolysaccharide export system permease protein
MYVRWFTKLDKYILKQFLKAFFFTLFLFSLICMVIDASEKTDDFVKEKLSTKTILVEYYAGFIPQMAALLFPIFVLITVIFVTGKLAQRSELIATLAAGNSLRRILWPFFMGGLILAAVLWVANGYVVPKATKKVAAFKSKYTDKYSGGYKEATNNIDHYFKLDSNTYAGVKGYDTGSKVAYLFFTHTIKNNRLTSNVRSNNFKWDTTKKKWHYETVLERNLKTLGEQNISVPIIDTAFNFTPINLTYDEYIKGKLINPELDLFIAQEKARGSESVKELLLEKYKRTSTAVAVIVLTLMGAIIASRKTRGGNGIHLAFGLVLGALLILTDRFSTVFATKGSLPPIVAACIPIILFGLFTIYLYRKAPK